MGERVAVKDLKLNETVTSFFLARNPQHRLRKTGEPFLTLLVADQTGELPAVMWEDLEGVGERIREGDLVKVHGVVGSYQGEMQLTIHRLRPAREGEMSRSRASPCSRNRTSRSMISSQTSR